MGTRASRLQEDPVPSAFGKDGTKRDSYRRPRCTRPTSLMVDFSGSFEDTEANRSRSEEGSDSDLGQHGASADGSPADHHSIPSSISQASPADDNNSEGKPEEDGNISPEPPVVAEHQSGEETGRTPHRTFSERLPGNRHSSARSVGARSARVRGTHQRPVSEAWIGLYRVNNRHGSKLIHLHCPLVFSIDIYFQHLWRIQSTCPIIWSSSIFFFFFAFRQLTFTGTLSFPQKLQGICGCVGAWQYEHH